MRLAMPAEEDTWVCDAHGDGVLVWQAPAATSLTGELRTVAGKVGELVGADRRPRSALTAAGTAPSCSPSCTPPGSTFSPTARRQTLEPDNAFTKHTLTDDRGRKHVYDLTDRKVTSPTPTLGANGPSSAARSPDAAPTGTKPRS